MSLQAVFMHKANAEDGVAPALFEPATVETFEDKQKRAEQDTYAAISNSHGEASVSNSLVSARVVQSQSVKTSEQSEGKKKEKDHLAKAARDLAEWLEKMDEKIEQLRAEIVEHRQRSQDLFEEAEELEELAEAIKNSDELSENQQRKIAEIRRENPGINDLEIIMLMHDEAERSRAEARIENQLAEEKSEKLARHLEVAAKGRQMDDVYSNAPEDAKPALVDDIIELMNKSSEHMRAAEHAMENAEDASLQSKVDARLEVLRNESEGMRVEESQRDNQLASFSFAPVNGV